jgi:hypothetical protein
MVNSPPGLQTSDMNVPRSLSDFGLPLGNAPKLGTQRKSASRRQSHQAERRASVGYAAVRGAHESVNA